MKPGLEVNITFPNITHSTGANSDVSGQQFYAKPNFRFDIKRYPLHLFNDRLLYFNSDDVAPPKLEFNFWELGEFNRFFPRCPLLSGS